jgi:transposase
MFVRTKSRGSRTYLQIVENHRLDGKIVQNVIANLGRLDLLQESGGLDSLMLSLQRFSPKLALLGEIGRQEANPLTYRRLGSPLLFGRLWRELGVDRAIEKLAKGRKFGFSLERVIFTSVVQRLVHSGSDRAALRWLTDYRLEGTEELELQHFYRAMAWLGTPLPEVEQDGATPFSPRCLKDLLEEELFSRRRGLFTDLDLVFFDTTSIYFEGKGGASLGRYGYSKDHRPDLPQLVVGMVLDNSGYPVCAEIWPGNTADVSSMLPVAERLRRRFHIGKVCLVADRGMVSADTRKALEAMGWFYILGARMRSSKEVGEEVLADESPFREIVEERRNSKDPAPLKVKEVSIMDTRYVVCLNEEEARKDRHDREAIVAGLEDALKRGDKSLVGNKGYRRYLSNNGRHFSLDRNRVENEKRFDGKWVLVTNTSFPAEEVAGKYKQLIQVEDIFRQTKSLLETRPIFHKRDETIRGHVWCSFLALILRKELRDRLEACRKEDEERLEWAGIVEGLESLGEAEIASGGKKYLWRSEAKKAAVKAFSACGMALPPVIRQII